MTLTEDDKRMLVYFCECKGDPTRWVEWEEKLLAIKAELPLFYMAWAAKVSSDRAFDQAWKALES